ncbi:MAG: PilZ domain-containing protein [Treponemataceae bacterium]|nr:PilZ domain-containing protein [Treponemataceae bacterium]
MDKELRRHTRFVEIGRVDAPDVCLFSGILVDISLNGCKVRFPAKLEIDADVEYELKILTARKDFSAPFILIANVSWLKNTENSCDVGFSIIRSPSTREFEKYIQSLEDEKADEEAEENLLKGFEK